MAYADSGYNARMLSDPGPYLPFSQRTGLEQIPPQLKLGDASPDLRRLVHYYLKLEIERNSFFGYERRSYHTEWRRVARDLHVLFFKQSPDSFDWNVGALEESIKIFVYRSPIVPLFDLIEFFIRHPGCSPECKRELAEAFVTARAAYRVVDNSYVAAIGSDEQAATFEQALATARNRGAVAARKQLIGAGIALRDGDWAGSVRESIHAVEAVAVQLAPGTRTLGAALKAIEQKHHLHGGLKKAFDALYGYSSDEQGVRHALVFSDEAQVDEADALFMLGACASFVSYLLAHAEPNGNKQPTE